MKATAIGLALATLTLIGCASGDTTPSYEEFRAETRRTFEGKEYFVVSGDIGVTEDQLRALYAKNFGDGIATIAQDSIVDRIGGRDDKWTASQALNLTYCVTDDFGSLKARVVSEMAQATAAWEAVARVNFTYVPAQDSNCIGSNANILFAVRPYTDGGACSFFPSGSACVSWTLVIDIADLDTNPFYLQETPNVKTVGVFRHELGHILGLRHEHTRPNSGTCFEDNSWRALTPYDRDSVMHYPWCNGNSQSSLSLTASDITGVRALYGTP